MANQSVTLALDGQPTIDDLATALTSWRALLRAIEHQVSTDSSVDWVIEGLDYSSAIAVARGVAEDPAVVDATATRFLEVVREETAGARLGKELDAPFRALSGLLNDRVPSIRFENDEDEVTIAQPTTTAVMASVVVVRHSPSLGGVRGRVHTLTSRRTLRFTLYDDVFDKAVSCYLQPGQEDIMRDVWGRVAVVEGMVTRDAETGRPITIRRVSKVTPVAEQRAGAWREARGALAGASDEPAEVTIRRIRDAQ